MKTPLNKLHIAALEKIKKGEITQAIDLFNQACALTPDSSALYTHLGLAYQKNSQPELAEKSYLKALAIEPEDTQAHVNLATLYQKQNYYSQTVNHYYKALQVAPDFTLAHFNVGLLLLKTNQLNKAKIEFNNVLTLSPGHADALFYKGIIHLTLDELDDAIQAFEYVKDNPKWAADTLTNLGVIALKQEQPQLAIDYFSKALTYDISHIEARNNLAATFIHHDRYENALTHYAILLENDPHNAEFLYNSGVAQMALGHLDAAIVHFEEVLSLQPEQAAAMTNLAAINMRLNKKDRARLLLEQSLQINPDDASTKHLLNALSGDTTTAPTCPEYANLLFNNYALYYDNHMQQQLRYKLPIEIEKFLEKWVKIPCKTVLDLGCGTGLVGERLRLRTTHLTGVDIAKKMLDKAREKNLYDVLIEREALDFLKSTDKYYDLIVIADVCPYIGDLTELIYYIKQHLNPNGYCLLSTEISEYYPFQLQSNARFSHHPDHLLQSAARTNLTLLAQETVIAREQEGLPVKEILMLFSAL